MLRVPILIAGKLVEDKKACSGWKDTSQRSKHSEIFRTKRNYGMVPSLDAFSEFHLTVLAYNSKGAGPESEPFIFQTPEGR